MHEAEETRERRVRPKVAAATVGGSLVTVVLYALDSYGISVTPEVAAALATLAAFGFGYLRTG